MTPVADMENDRLVKWMDKTKKSLPKTRNSGLQRRYELVDRHFEIKDEMVKRDIWNKYCDDRGFCPTHDGS